MDLTRFDESDSTRVAALIAELSTLVPQGVGKGAKFAIVDCAIRLALDSCKPRGVVSHSDVVAYLKENTSSGPLLGAARMASRFGLVFVDEGRYVALSTVGGKRLELREDKAHSARCLVEAALVELANEHELNAPVHCTYTRDYRAASIEALSPYDGVRKGHYDEYLTRLSLAPVESAYIPVDGNDVICGETGQVNIHRLKPNSQYEVSNLDQSSVSSLLQYCGIRNIGMRFLFQRIHLARKVKLSNPSLESEDDGLTLVYRPSRPHPARPLVPGPEDDKEKDRVKAVILRWLRSGDCAYKSFIPSHTMDVAEGYHGLRYWATPVFSMYNSAVHALPPPIACLIRELVLGSEDVCSKLDSLGYRLASPHIYKPDSRGLYVLSGACVKRIRQAEGAIHNPGAYRLVAVVHGILSEKDYYVDENSVPKDPWKAAVNYVCRHLSRYGLDNPYEAEDDIYPVSTLRQRRFPNLPNVQLEAPQPPRTRDLTTEEVSNNKIIRSVLSGGKLVGLSGNQRPGPTRRSPVEDVQD